MFTSFVLRRTRFSCNYWGVVDLLMHMISAWVCGYLHQIWQIYMWHPQHKLSSDFFQCLCNINRWRRMKVSCNFAETCFGSFCLALEGPEPLIFNDFHVRPWCVMQNLALQCVVEMKRKEGFLICGRAEDSKIQIMFFSCYLSRLLRCSSANALELLSGVTQAILNDTELTTLPETDTWNFLKLKRSKFTSRSAACCCPAGVKLLAVCAIAPNVKPWNPWICRMCSNRCLQVWILVLWMPCVLAIQFWMYWCACSSQWFWVSLWAVASRNWEPRSSTSLK